MIDKRLDRLQSFDERSRNFPVRTALPKSAKKPRSYTWSCGKVLDQGSEGACVGFAWAHEIIARPSVWDIQMKDALQIYRMAQLVDEWPGENYSGTSVLAGIKAVQKLFPGFIKEYRWAFDVHDVIMTLGYLGPVVLGVNWYEEMYTPSKEGFLIPGGRKVGGHAILAKAVNVKEDYIVVHNSWGESWGNKGTAKIHITDLIFLLEKNGECCVPMGRKKK